MLTSNLLKKHISKESKSQRQTSNNLNKLSDAISHLSKGFEGILQNNLSQNIMQLNQNIQKLVNVKLNQANQQAKGDSMEKQLKIETRFQTIKVPVLKVELTDENREKKIKKWLGNMAKQVTSTTFQKFLKSELNERATKAYCSENILLNILKLYHENQMSKSDIQLINKTLRDTIFPYIKIKYPQSEDAEVNLALNKRVTRIDDFQNNRNDLFYKSQIQFQYSEEKDYNEKIMEFLNYLIKLPQKTIREVQDREKQEGDSYFNVKESPQKYTKTLQKSEENSLYQNFQGFFQELFERLGNEEKVHTMMLSKDFNKVEHFLDQIDEKQKLKYREKVSSYTKYLIGRKLSENIKQFSASAIRDGNIKLSNSALMRIVTKWCQELRQNFSDPYKIAHKHGQFKMKDGSQRYLSLNESNILYQLLSQRQEKIQKWLSVVRKDNFLHQHDFSQIELLLDSDLEIFSEDESIVGIFSAVTRKNYQTYLIGYLKELIHQLLKVMDEFQALAYFRDDWRSWDDIQNNQSTLSEGKKLKKQKAESKDSQVPNLITFKLSDLLRCKCSSREMEINALYNEIQRINEQNPSLLKIVKVKNRLQRGTRDVLMNLMFKKEIVIEIQLAVNTNKSNFVDCSDKFNHFIYELERSEFGPISEMCNLWTNFDERASFFIKQFQKRNISKKEFLDSHTQIYSLRDGQYDNIILPFRCDKCDRFYSDTLFVGEHRKYKEDHFQLCFPCLLEELKTYNKIKASLIPDLPILDENEEEYDIQPVSEIDQQFPSSGLLIKLKSKNKEVKNFKTVQRGNKKFVIEKSSLAFNVLGNVTSKKDRKIFLEENIIFNQNDLLQRSEQINEQDVVKQFFIPKLFEETNMSKKNSIKINHEKLIDNIIQLAQPLKEVKTVNLAQNKLQRVQSIVQKFPQMNTLILENNQISNLGGLQILLELKQINLSRNSISKLPEDIKFLKKLKKLSLKINKIAQLPDSFCELVSLKELNLSQNSIKTLPKDFGQLQNLEVVFLHINSLVQIPESFSKLKKLVIFYVYSNKLSQLPESFGELESLKKLYISVNQIQKLPESFGNLTNLQILYLNHNNPLTELPQGFGNLKKLYILYIFNTNINHLSEQILNLSDLIEFRDEYLNYDKQSVQIKDKLHSICEENEKKRKIKK